MRRSLVKKIAFTLQLLLSVVVFSQETETITITRGVIGFITDSYDSSEKVFSHQNVKFGYKNVRTFRGDYFNFNNQNGEIYNLEALPGPITKVEVEVFAIISSHKWELSLKSGANGNYSVYNENATSWSGIQNNSRFFRLRHINSSILGINSNNRVLSVKITYRKPITETIWENNRWSNGEPTLERTAIIRGNLPTQTSNKFYEAKELIFETNAIIPDKVHFKVQNGVKNTNNKEVIFEHGSTLIQVNKDAQNSGKFTFKRKSKPLYRLDMMLWSSPVAGQNVYALSPKTVTNRFLEHRESDDTWSSTVLNAQSTFGKGKGIVFRTPNDFNSYNNGNGIAQQFEGTFKGELFNGDVVLDVLNTNTGYNVVGNPYGSPIYIKKFLEINPNVTSIFVWTANNKVRTGGKENWVQFSLTDWADPNMDEQFLNISTAFIVKVKDGQRNQIVKFTNEMRTVGNPLINYRTNDNENKFWLSLSNGTTTLNSTFVGYSNDATNSFEEELDAKAIGMVEGLYTNLDGETMTFQRRNLSTLAQDQVKVDINVEQAGTYTISLDKFKGEFADGTRDIFIKDALLNEKVNLTEESTYTFTTEAGLINDRFTISYQEKTLDVIDDIAVDNSEVIVYTDQKVAKVLSKENIQSVQVFNINGQIIAERFNVNATEVGVNVGTNQKQILIVNIQLTNGKFIRKKLII